MNALSTWTLTMPRSRAIGNSSDAVYRPDLPADHPDRMNLNMTVRDRRQLEVKAKENGISPTKWLLREIWDGVDDRPTEGQKSIAIALPEAQVERLRGIAQSLGLGSTSILLHMAAVQMARSPDLAETLIFGGERSTLATTPVSQPKRSIQERSEERMRASRKDGKGKAA